MYKRYRNNLLYFAVLIIFMLGFSVVYGVYGGDRPLYKSWAIARNVSQSVKPKINADTVIRKEIRYLCGDKVSTGVPTTSDLIGLDFSGVVGKYSPEQGWKIDDTVKNELVLASVEETVCPYHREYRHLGISDGFLAVYEGPLGFNQKVLQREDITIESLPPEIQSGLGMAMEYDNQEPDTQGKLKSYYEFESEAQLNSALENFDEFKE